MTCKRFFSYSVQRMSWILMIPIATCTVLVGAKDVDTVFYPKSLGEIKTTIALLKTQRDASDNIKGDYLQRLKMYRYICGVPFEDLTWSAELEDDCNQACLVFALNNAATHRPFKPVGMSDETFEKARRGAFGNLFVGLANPIGCVDVWMYDSIPGAFNAASHRRWCLNPWMQKTAFASRGPFAVMSNDGTRESVPDWDYVAYPARGYMPLDLIGKGAVWSVSLNMDKYATPLRDIVTVTIRPVNEKLVDVKEPLKLDCLTVENRAFGSGPAIIFRPESFVASDDTRYRVTIDGLHLTNGESAQIRYIVHFIDMQKVPDAPDKKPDAGFEHLCKNLGLPASATASTNASPAAVAAMTPPSATFAPSPMPQAPSTEAMQTPQAAAPSKVTFTDAVLEQCDSRLIKKLDTPAKKIFP